MTGSQQASVLPRPLEDVTVIDLTLAYAGPVATFFLAGLGARVIKIENPATGDMSRTNPPYLGRDGLKLVRDHPDDMSIPNINRSRNKMGVTLNLKHPRARQIFSDLLRVSDVVVENYSRGTMERLGFDYELAREINPRIVYCSISGFGTKGDPSDNKSMDVMIQALSGLMEVTGGEKDPPMRSGIPIGDLVSPLFAVVAVLSALNQVRRTGLGQRIDVSMVGALTALVAGEHFDALEMCGLPIRTGNSFPRMSPFGVFKAKDGYVAIAAPTDAFAGGVFAAMGQPELMEDDRFRTRDMRTRNMRILDPLIDAWSSQLTVAEVMERLERAGVPVAPVRRPQEAVRDPRVVGGGATVPLSHPIYGAVAAVYGTGLPLEFSGATVGFDRPAPSLGQHNEAVYGEILGYSSETLAELRSEGAI